MLAVKVVFVDTLHLFPETLDFLKEVEARYGFTAEVFTPTDFKTVEQYRSVHGVDLPIRDIEKCAASSAASLHHWMPACSSQNRCILPCLQSVLPDSPC